MCVFLLHILTQTQRLIVYIFLTCRFFEWQRKGSQKQPYYIYFPQPDSAGVKAEIKEEIKEEKEADEDDERVGKRLLTMAGVFDVWHSPEVSIRNVSDDLLQGTKQIMGTTAY